MPGGLRPEKKNFTTENTESTEERGEKSSGDSLSVSSVFSVVKHPICRRHIHDNQVTLGLAWAEI